MMNSKITPLPRIGFGTAKLGGNIFVDRARDDFYLSALRSALELGYTHFDTAENYARGHAEELLGRAVRETRTRRENIFIATKIAPAHLSYQGILKSCENSLRRLGVEYLDLYMPHSSGFFRSLNEVFRALNHLVKSGKVRHIGVSNFYSLKQLKEAQELSDSPLTTNQAPYNLFFRAFSKNGILEYCQKNGIWLTAAMPIKLFGNRLRRNKVVQAIAQAHSATPSQIALAWLVSQPFVATIPMSFNPQHQKENLTAAEIKLTEAETAKLNLLS
jgi:diketogulonate reductase-like aldo/keto reductase